MIEDLGWAHACIRCQVTTIRFIVGVNRIHSGKTDAETDYNPTLKFIRRYVFMETLVTKSVKHRSSPKNLTMVMGTEEKFMSS